MPDNRFGKQTLNTSEKKWQLSKSSDIAIIDDYVNEALSIGGADINVFKLLGVHEQGLLVDLAGNGVAISGGTANASSPSNAFYDQTNQCTDKLFWRSSQKGLTSILTSGFIGYNFGSPKLDNNREKYGVDVDIKHHITTLRITNSVNPNRRSLRLRVERSDDGITWLGVDVIELADDDSVQQVSIKQSAMTRYWRLRPLSFTGGDDDFWEINSVQLIDWDQTNLFQVQDDFGFIENRDRDYADNSITIKGYFDLFEKESDLTKFGFAVNGGIYYITVNFNDIVNRLGRPIVIGDILELPNEAMFDPNMKEIKKYLEVSDISWSAEGYAPGWQPTMLRIIADPMLAKQETMDIVGDLAGAIDQSGLFEIDKKIDYSNLHETSERSREKAESDVPLRGSDTSKMTSFESETIDQYNQLGVDITKMSINQKALYVEDGIPPNGLPYTEGPEYPLNPEDKQYHRVTYNNSTDNTVPARLFRYSSLKTRWIFVEKDLRDLYNKQQPTIAKLKESKNAISARDIGK